MSLPLLEYQLASQNHRVEGFEVGGDQQPWIYSTSNLLSQGELDDLIAAAYRQIFNEQQMTSSSRQAALESQLRNGQMTVRQFIAGLATSGIFRSRNFDTNNNYRFVQMCVQRILGREVYNDREKFAWSTLIATKGLNAFINELVNTDEYLANFGDNTVPYQRRRILPQQASGSITFAHMARYDEFYRANLPEPSSVGYGSAYRWAWQTNPPPALRQAGAVIIWSGVAGIGLVLVAALLGW
ncbi:MAG: phycobilisome rod-core linker polypeptide CpcG [Alkalinema sp. RL_2_19]|nr:phycobilisome rod-core linker polypeptide CpcG [Alkalinema sp. RL_2_19]